MKNIKVTLYKCVTNRLTVTGLRMCKLCMHYLPSPIYRTSFPEEIRRLRHHREERKPVVYTIQPLCSISPSRWFNCSNIEGMPTSAEMIFLYSRPTRCLEAPTAAIRHFRCRRCHLVASATQDDLESAACRRQSAKVAAEARIRSCENVALRSCWLLDGRIETILD